jgi:hypothetical protein
MYTPDEANALKQLRDQCHTTHLETSIKEVKGGYIIQHVTHYLDENGTIMGQTRDQFVTADQWGVRDAINSLYPDSEFKPEPADYVTSPPQNCPDDDIRTAMKASMPKPEEYATEQYVPKDALPDEFGGLARVPGTPARAPNAPVPEPERSFSRKDY